MKRFLFSILSVAALVLGLTSGAAFQRVSFPPELVGFTYVVPQLVDSATAARPFNLAHCETTNADYRAFVHFVRDSLLTRHVYLNHPDASEVWHMLDIPKNVRLRRPDTSKRLEYLRQYGLRVEPIDLNDTVILQIVDTFFYPRNERFYKRHQFRTDLWSYRISEDSVIAVYPDTTGFMKYLPGTEAEMLSQMYFWHPAYDNYPVVNISYDQALAFCRWKTCRYNEQAPVHYRVRFTLPSLEQYRLALLQASPDFLRPYIHDAPNSDFSVFPPSVPFANGLLHSVFKTPGKKSDPETIYDYLFRNAWQHAAQATFRFLDDNVAEYCSSPVDKTLEERCGLPHFGNFQKKILVLGSDYGHFVQSLNEFQQNTLFYKQVKNRNESDCFTGFRLVCYSSTSSR